MNFQAFDSLDEMFDAMHEAEKEANLHVTNAQKSIGWGDHWYAVYPDMELVVFGEIYESLDKLCQDELDAGAGTETIEYVRTSETNAFSRGYRFGTAYSVITPEGELGSTHISSMAPITPREFDLARALNWDGERWVAVIRLLRDMGWNGRQS